MSSKTIRIVRSPDTLGYMTLDGVGGPWSDRIFVTQDNGTYSVRRLNQGYTTEKRTGKRKIATVIYDGLRDKVTAKREAQREIRASAERSAYVDENTSREIINETGEVF